MRCEACREVVSAHLDGADGPDEWDEAQIHLRGCVDCRDFAVHSEKLTRLTRVRPVDDVADLTPAILAAAVISDSAHDPNRPIRLVLCAAALVQIALAVPALVLGDDAN